MRRRGYPAAAIRHFCKRIGITKYNGTSDVALLEHDIRDHLNATAPRRMAVLDPLKVVIGNFSEEPTANLVIPNHPQDDSFGEREVSFSPEIFIEREDFQEIPEKKYFRLAPDKYVRLRGGPIIRCTGFEKNAAGEITLVRAELLPDTTGKDSPAGVVCKAAIHWVDAATAADAEVRLYDRLFTVEDPDAAEGGFLSVINPDSVKPVTAKIEACLLHEAAGSSCQFERSGYFITDSKDHVPGQKAVFNRTVALKDSWVKSK
jgi:glutaminyl-tRNA synthetase